MKYILALLAFFFAMQLPVITLAATESAVLAGGCFWCVESDFDKVPGVVKTISGYTGGAQVNPSYEQVSSGGTGHYESVEIFYDPAKISYEKILDIFWRNIDPTDVTGQFCDKGQQYRAVIFYKNEAQRKIAEASKEKIIKSGRFKNVVTEILPAKTFYPAEEYHQDYHDKNPVRYNFYRYRCGRDARLQQLWGTPS